VTSCSYLAGKAVETAAQDSFSRRQTHSEVRRHLSPGVLASWWKNIGAHGEIYYE